MRYAFALAALVFTGASAAADPAEGIYRFGNDRVLSVSSTTDNYFEFELAIGVADGENTCSEGDVSCLSITGSAEASAGGFTYVDPDGEGSITFQLKGEDILIASTSGALGSGSGNAQRLDRIAGLYKLALQSGYVYFQTPSGNIGCAIWLGKGSFLRCDMKELRQTYKERPSDCEFSWGSAFEVDAAGKGQVVCFNDTALDPRATKLEYGRALELGGFRCLSEKTGLTCKNAAGHGFKLSKARQEVF